MSQLLGNVPRVGFCGQKFRCVGRLDTLEWNELHEAMRVVEAEALATNREFATKDKAK